MPHLEKLVVLDICDTLYRSNTTFDFIRFALQKQQKSWQAFLLKGYTTKYSPLFLLFYFLQKITKKDVCKIQSLKLLKGTTQQVLEDLATQFQTDYLHQKKIAPTHELLHQFKTEGVPIVFLSASIDPVVRAIEKDFEVDCF